MSGMRNTRGELTTDGTGLARGGIERMGVEEREGATGKGRNTQCRLWKMTLNDSCYGPALSSVTQSATFSKQRATFQPENMKNILEKSAFCQPEICHASMYAPRLMDVLSLCSHNKKMGSTILLSLIDVPLGKYTQNIYPVMNYIGLSSCW